jgi:hypothetical protein
MGASTAADAAEAAFDVDDDNAEDTEDTEDTERLFLEEIDDVLDLVTHAERYRVDYNTVRPHEALSWNRPHDVHIGLADPRVPNFPEPQILPTA